jgi:hypothetical protein
VAADTEPELPDDAIVGVDAAAEGATGVEGTAWDPAAAGSDAALDATPALGPAKLTFPAVFMNCTISAIGPVTVMVGIPPLARRSKFEMTICMRATTTPSISTTR